MGLSFGEMVVLAFLALMVVGPKDLPKMLRSAGRFLGQARRAIEDVRKETGLDDVLRGDLRDLERLADHIERLEPYKGDGVVVQPSRPTIDWEALRLREYPVISADGGSFVPEDAVAYRDLPVALPPMAQLEPPAVEEPVAAVVTTAFVDPIVVPVVDPIVDPVVEPFVDPVEVADAPAKDPGVAT